jgi:hypothetical protein
MLHQVAKDSPGFRTDLPSDDALLAYAARDADRFRSESRGRAKTYRASPG